jgi:Cu2+-exporting ATPase/Cu+-exporting ATPase
MEISPESFSKCHHCGANFRGSSQEFFCCAGCKFVYELLQQNGMSEFYRLRDANPPPCPLPQPSIISNFAFFDDPEFKKKFSRDDQQMEFYLEGMTCTACLWLLEKLPELCADVTFARVNMATSTIFVKRSPSGSFATIAGRLNQLGYRPHPIKDEKAASALQKREWHQSLIRVGLAGALTGNIMILAVSNYAGAQGLLLHQFQILLALLATPILTYCAWPFYKAAWSAVASRRLNVDVPIVAALLAGIIMSGVALKNGTDAIYFDSLSMLVFLLLASRLFLKSVQSRHLDISHLENDLLMGAAQRIGANGKVETISALGLRRGDLIQIEGEMKIPVDGRVLNGTGWIETAVMTGESDALQIQTGSSVEAGSCNLSGSWQLLVEKPLQESRLANILREAERSRETKPRMSIFADRIAQWFVGTVMVFALAIVLYFLGSNPQEGFTRALCMIIVTCPCVFGMAIPLSMSLAIRNSARRGIIITNADAVERLWAVKKLFFDKTGTLTSGKMTVLNANAIDASALAIANALECNQSHPVGKSIVQLFQTIGGEKLTATDVEVLPNGRGIAGRVAGDWCTIEPDETSNPQTSLKEVRARFGLFVNSKQRAVFEIGDRLRDEAKDVIGWAREQGYSICLLSGDRKPIAEHCALSLGLEAAEVIAESSPELKSQTIKETKVPCAMIGDGANDAAALTAASVGIAVRGALDASLRASDVYLLRSDLSGLPELFLIANQANSAIKRNLLFTVSFNLLSGALAATGHMTPLWAAVLMPLSSVTVLISAIWTGQAKA